MSPNGKPQTFEVTGRDTVARGAARLAHAAGLQRQRRGDDWTGAGAWRRHAPGRRNAGFTLIELMIVIVIVGIAAAIAVPMMSSAASFQIRAAANMIAADLEYAKSMAISRGQPYSVVFDVDNESYEIVDQDGAAISNPITKDPAYVVDFRNNGRIDRVDIADADFDGVATVTFDYLGSPYSGANPLNSGTITLEASDAEKTIVVEPVTGYISISN